MQAPNSKSIVDKLVSYPALQNVKVPSLVRQYDVSDTVYKLNAALQKTPQNTIQGTSLITEIQSGGLFITSPGTYLFGNDIVWTPGASAANAAAITISCDNVILNLSGFSLSATVADNSQLLYGIAVHNATNVSISNGTLRNMCYCGVNADTVQQLSIENLQIDGLLFNNLEQRNLSPTGISISKSSNINLFNCSVQNMYVAADASAGIQLLETVGGKIEGCSLNRFHNWDGSVQGFSYFLCASITTTNCNAAHFRSFFNGNVLAIGHTVIGFVPMFSVELNYQNCSATYLTGCCDDCHGMSLFMTALVEVNQFSASAILDGAAPSNSGAKATGLEVYGAAITISNSTVELITAIQPQDRQAAGFAAAGGLISFNNCTANKVTVMDGTNTANTASGHGLGFGWAPDPRPQLNDMTATSVEYTNCSANDCQVGFDTWFHVDSTWTNVSTSNCVINIRNEPNGTRTLACGPCSECKTAITATLINKAKNNTYPGSGG